MAKKKQTEKPPALDKLLKPALGVALAVLAYYFMKGLDAEISRVDVTDELALREVFFGEGQGKSYAVLCHTLPGEDEKTKPLPISSVFQDAMDEITSGTTSPIAEFVLIDCNFELPSGHTIAKRFKLNTAKRPTIFISGKVGEPKQVPEKHLKTGHMLAKVLKGMLEPHAAKIESTKDLKSKCLNKNVCALLMKGGPPQQFLKDAFKNLLNQYPDVQFASVDSATMLLTNLEEHMPEYSKGNHRFVVFKKISGGIAAGKDGKQAEGRLITSIAPLEEDADISYGSMSNLLNAVKNGSKKAKKLSSLPQVKSRTKKLEESERKKRERTANKTPGQKPKTTPGGSFQENDGSREGRKAERDRRREEHKKNNPNYREKTPEELAEMERKRRERMAEESAKWNIGSEDDYAEGDETEDSFFDTDDGEEYDDIDEEEDEDILDLD